MNAVLEEVLARARELVGRRQDEDCGTPSVKDFCRYAAALNDGEYLRRARALAAAGQPVEAPALFLAATLSWEDGPPEEELRPDGLARRESPCTEGLAVRQVHGGQTVRLLRPLFAGTPVTAARAVVAARHKQGRSGEFVLLDLQTRFLDADGEELTCVDETIVVLP
ncbi:MULTISPECIES: FAS1-like dehydratase domain-containing protein [Streptomyces]|uniref:MaoC family dehydratase N-terminal domain-containing protein n=2 Tax=Streptomyces TaxID=1883 RepID=A0ABV9IQQ1_9ACTN